MRKVLSVFIAVCLVLSLCTGFTINFTVAAALSSDATLKASSTVKGETLLGLGRSSASGDNWSDGGTVTITAAEAANTTNLTPYITLFDPTDAGATVKVVKYSQWSNVGYFDSLPAYANQAITNQDYFWVKVTAPDTTTLYYKVNVTVTPAPATNATLRALTSSVGTLSPTFAAGTITYSVVLPYGTTVVPTVTAAVTDPKAHAVVTPAGSLPGTTTVVVTAEDGSTKKTYTINFTVAAPADTTPPVVTITAPAANAQYILGQTVLANWTATDDLSGIFSAVGTVPSGSPIDTGTVGTKTFTVTATDNAGNTVTKTITYYVQYGFNGLLSPYVAPPKTFKLGSSIPLKWQYTNFAGTVVDSSAANPSVEIRLVIAGTTTPTEDKPITVNNPGSSGLRYDSLTMTWQFNWQTKGLAAGVYNIYIKSNQTGQTNGPFSIQLK